MVKNKWSKVESEYGERGKLEMATIKLLSVYAVLLSLFVATVVIFLANRVKPVRLKLESKNRSAGRRMGTK